MTKVYVNGEECNLHATVGWLNYDRVVRLSGLPEWGEYNVTVEGRDIGGGIMPVEGLSFTVAHAPKKPWWRWLWPS